jgi:hypothetical protein
MLTLNRRRWELKIFRAASKKAAATSPDLCPKFRLPCPESGFAPPTGRLNLEIKKFGLLNFCKGRGILKSEFSNRFGTRSAFYPSAALR